MIEEEALRALQHELAERQVTARLDPVPVPFLVIPVPYLRRTQVLVYVQRGRAAPDTYVWDEGHRYHHTRDPSGTADRVIGHMQNFGPQD